MRRPKQLAALARSTNQRRNQSSKFGADLSIGVRTGVGAGRLGTRVCPAVVA
jgi:hypothetical protein